MKILIVDDNYAIRSTCEMILSHSGVHEIRQAVDGQDALEQLEKFSAELLLADNRMPYIMGPELITRAKKMNPAIRTILMSGEDVEELASACGADMFFKKPIRPKELRDAIELLGE